MPSPERIFIESLLQIANKEGQDVPFYLNSAQEKLDNGICDGHTRHIIPKARQEGVSSYVLALFLIRCMRQRNRRCVVISHDAKSTETLFNRVKYYISHMRGAKPKLGSDSRIELTFPKNDSTFYIGTAGARKFGRGDTVTDLHCSEVAFWPDPKSITSGLFQAVPRSGWIFIESTGNGQGNWYHKRCMRSVSGNSRYRMHFLDWQSFPEYSVDLTPEEEYELMSSLNADIEEPQLVKEWNLTPGQLAFRREKLDELDWDLDLFKQEYPMTLDECFKSSGTGIFKKINYVPTQSWNRENLHFWCLKGHPHKRGIYSLGIDGAGGVGKDRTVGQIVECVSMEQVGEWVSDRHGPDDAIPILLGLATRFNESYIVVENEKYGIVMLHELKKSDYPRQKIHRSKYGRSPNDLSGMGIPPNARTKMLAIGKLRTLLARPDGLVVHSPLLKDELDTFIEHDNGKLGAIDEDGIYDDRVTALAMSVMGVTKALLVQPIKRERRIIHANPFLLDNIINELHGRNQSFPIRSHVRVLQ